MALDLRISTKNKCLNNVFRPSQLYVMIPAVDGAPNNTDLPREEIKFNIASANGWIGLEREVKLTVQEGTTIDKVYLNDTALTKGDVAGALVTINLDGDDVEFYENNGVYIINTLRVAIHT